MSEYFVGVVNIVFNRYNKIFYDVSQALYECGSKRKGEEAISYISSYQTLTEDNNSTNY